MKALEGIRVLDLTHALAGPFCTYQLQLLGADVIKVEKPEVGDDFRDLGVMEKWGVGPTFLSTNGGKRSITINLKSEAGRDLVLRLAESADVVVENLRPGVAERLGLGWEAMKALKSDIIYCSISGFGQTGEMKSWPAYDHTVKSVAGMAWSGASDEIPSQAHGFSIDCFSGYLAYAAILSALVRRERTGEGQFLDVAMFDSSMVLRGVGIVRTLMTGETDPGIQPIVMERPTVAPYATIDGWIWLSVNFQQQWEALCRVLDCEYLLEDPRFATQASRNAHKAQLQDILSDRIAPLSAVDLESKLMRAGCPAARVRTTAEALAMSSVNHRQVLQEGMASGEPVKLVGAGFCADKDAPVLKGPVPALGEHTDEVLRELGLSDHAIAELRLAKVV